MRGKQCHLDVQNFISMNSLFENLATLSGHYASLKWYSLLPSFVCKPKSAALSI